MKKHHTRSTPARRPVEGGFVTLRPLIGFTLCFVGIALALFARLSPLTDRASLPSTTKPSRPEPYMPVPGARPEGEAEDLGRLEQFWTDRLTYPTGRFDPAWLRAAAAQHSRLRIGVPAGAPAALNPLSPLALSTTSFIA